MRIPKNVKEEFLNKHKNQPFELSEIGEEIDEYFEFDLHKAQQQALNNFRRSFISSIKDGKKIREFYAYEETGKTFYVCVSGKINFNAQKGILHNIQSKKTGLIKAEKKVKKATVIENQTSIFDQASNI
jgi:hypothetical protein